MSYLRMALKVIKQDQAYKINRKMVLAQNATNPTTEERQETLLDCMTATWETISKPYLKTGYKLTSEIKEAESEIEKVQAGVLQGKAKLEDFRKACINWEKAVRKNANRD